MGRKIDAEKRAEIVRAYLENDGATYKDIGARFGINQNTISRIIKEELQAGNGIKPDRRSKPAQQPDWMAYVTPLHQHKRELEKKVLHKKAELDKALQELRDFTATLKKLMTEGNT
jgi:transposase-like protein